MNEYVYIRIPREDWKQIVDDLENMCGVPAREIDILKNAKILDDRFEIREMKRDV
jgi:hypothetical protein